MAEQHETFPGKFEAFLLIAALIVIEILLTIVVLETGLLADIGFADVAGFITVVGNGILSISTGVAIAAAIVGGITLIRLLRDQRD